MSIVIIAFMIYRFGFQKYDEVKEIWVGANTFFYSIFILYYFIRFGLASIKSDFLRQNWFESSLILIILYDGISLFIFGHPILERIFLRLGIFEITELYHFGIQSILLILVSIELVKSINFIINSRIKPATLFILSFVVLIFSGAGLLMLPGFNRNSEFLSFVDALFTASSASCVTGLSVVNTATFFNFKGQLVILFLIQLGGLGILSFSSFFTTFIKKGMGIKHQIAMNELLDSESLSGSLVLLKRIFSLTLFIEAVGAIAIYNLWGDYPFENVGQKIYYSIFHSVSAFCNAGFSILEFGFETPLVSELYLMHIIVAFIIIFGGLGFPTIRDLFSPQRLRERMQQPWKGWKLSTKIAVYTSAALIIIGTLSFYFMATKHLGYLDNNYKKIISAFFQSVNTRTSGFNSIVIGELPETLLLITMFLMFIGASSSSTGGGIKTSTFIVICTAIYATITGKKEATLGRRTISKELIYKAFTIIIFAFNFILLIVTILTATEPNISFLNLSFETVSAFATVGLSTGITSSLSDFGKILISITMFAGRVGLLTLAFSLSSKDKNQSISYPKTHIMIG